MKFNINDYEGNYVMHCKTEEEAKDFCAYLDSVGRKWCNGESYLDVNEWGWYRENTIYDFNEGSYCSVDLAKIYNEIILEWSDFMSKEFTKANLKTGDVVKLRDGDVGIVNLGLDMCILSRSWLDLKHYDVELKDDTDLDLDIIAVRRPTMPHHCQFCAFDNNFGTLVYERKEVEEMTLEEVCKLLGKEIKIIK